MNAPKYKIKLKHLELSHDIQNVDGLTYLSTIVDNSIDLVLTDPPYSISRDSGMNQLHLNIVQKGLYQDKPVKTDDEWIKYKQMNDIVDDTSKDNYLQYGTIYGKKYCVRTDYGDWDSQFTLTILDQFIEQFYCKLKQGGTLIIFFDIWKITPLKEIMERHQFKQIRFIEWIKTNPQPRNSKINYLTNCREIALVGIKGKKPTFNSSYDNGLYLYPIQNGMSRFHPTQKNIELFKALIEKHTNRGETVLDVFLGGGTTAIACQQTGRLFKGCEISLEYYQKIIENVKSIVEINQK